MTRTLSVLLALIIAFTASDAFAKKKKRSEAKPPSKTKPTKDDEDDEDDEPPPVNVKELFERDKPPPPSVATTANASASAPPPSARWAAIDIALGVRLYTRSLSLTDDLFGAFFPHRQPFAAAPSLRLQWFPGAHFRGGVAQAFGVHAFANFAPGLRVRAPDGSVRAVTTFEAGGGVSARYQNDRFEGRVDFGVLGHQFTFADLPATAPVTAAQSLSVSYLALRPAVALRVKVIERLWLSLDGGYRVIVGSGQVRTLFPRSNGGGFDVALGGAVPIALGFEARATVEYAHYFFAMGAQPGDRYVLGGALDQYVGATLAFAWRR